MNGHSMPTAPARRSLVAGRRLPGALWKRIRAGVTGSPTAPAGSGRVETPDDQLWPRFDRLSLVSRRPTNSGLGGEHRSRTRAPSADFVDYRAYQPGDDFRRVDWNVYGRHGTLQVKITEAQERLDVLLLVDASASMRWGEPDKLAYALRTTAALAYVGLRRADLIRVVCLGEDLHAFGPARGRNRFPELIGFLQTVAPSGAVDLGEQLAEVLNRVPGRAGRGQRLIVVVSDLLTADLDRIGLAFDRLMAQGADIVVIQILSPQEESPDPEGEVELIDAETGERVEVGLSLDVVHQYQHRLGDWLARVEETCTSRGLRYTRVRTDQPLDSLILNELRRIQVVR